MHLSVPAEPYLLTFQNPNSAPSSYLQDKMVYAGYVPAKLPTIATELDRAIQAVRS